MRHTQTSSKFAGEPLVALLANGLFIVFVKFGFLIHFGIANRTREMMHTPCLIQRGEYVTTDNLIANEAEISEQLMIVRFTIGKATFFIMTMSQKRFLAFSTNKMLNMPMFS